MLNSLRLDMQAVKKVETLCIRYLSTQRTQSFRTTEPSPANHNLSNEAQFYKLAPETRKQLFSYGGIPKTYDIQTKTFVETCLMVRRPALDIINCIKSLDYEKPPPRFILYGQKGCGKSLTLANVLHHGLESGHLIVHIPWVGQWMRACKEYSNSTTKEGFVDINIDAAAWLLHFKTQNAHLLTDKELITSTDYNWSKRETTPKGSPLSDIIEHGMNRIKYASDCVVVLCKEVKRLSIEGKCKTLVAIDGVNAFFYPNTRVYTEKKEMVPPERVTLTEGFLELTKFNWKNGVCVLTVDEIPMKDEDRKSYLPRYLLGKKGFEHMDPFVPIKVDSYSQKELISCMDYYRERKWVQPVQGQDEELAFLSGSNPFKLMQLCAPL